MLFRSPHAPPPGERLLFKTQTSRRSLPGFDDAFVYIAEDAAQLLAAVRDVFAGGAPMSGNIARRVVEAFKKPAPTAANAAVESLSQREQEILQLLSEGYLYKEIADRLGVSYSTVRTHIERIYGKLHVQSRAQAVAKEVDRWAKTKAGA